MNDARSRYPADYARDVPLRQSRHDGRIRCKVNCGAPVPNGYTGVYCGGGIIFQPTGYLFVPCSRGGTRGGHFIIWRGHLPVLRPLPRPVFRCGCASIVFLPSPSPGRRRRRSRSATNACVPCSNSGCHPRSGTGTGGGAEP